MAFSVVSFARLGLLFFVNFGFPVDRLFLVTDDNAIGEVLFPLGGDHNISERAWVSWQLLVARHMDDTLGLRAEDVSFLSSALCDKRYFGRSAHIQQTTWHPGNILFGNRVPWARTPDRPPGNLALHQLPRNSAEEPTRASTTRPVRSALGQHVANSPALRSAFTCRSPRAVSTSHSITLRQVLPLFLVLRSRRICAIKANKLVTLDYQRRTNRFLRASSNIVQLPKEPGRS